MTKPRLHMVIPDVQARKDVDYQHLTWIGNYAAEKRPDVIVQIGDFTDMPSLSGYGVGKAEAEGRRYRDDTWTSHDAMSKLMKPILAVNRRAHRRAWEPDLELTLGNHENRIDLEANTNPKWKGFLTSKDLGYEKWGWKVHPFLKVVRIDDVEYSHYFIGGVMGRPVGSAQALLKQRQCSAVMGHVQKIDLAVHPNTQFWGLFVGICYLHDEPYLTSQGNSTKRGIWMLHEVRNGTFDPMFVSLDFLKRRYS